MFLGRWNSKKLQNHWNSVAQKIDDISQAPSTQIYRQSEIYLIRRYFGSLRGKRFLKLDLWNEVNNTRILSWVAKMGARVSGIDISSYLVEKTKENFDREGLKGTFVLCDMRSIKFPDDSFDLVYTMGTIEHVHDYIVAVRELFRVLKPGGKAIIGVPNRHDPFLRPLVVWILDKLELYAYSPEHSFSRRELRLMLEGVGFEIKADTGVLFMPGILRLTELFLFKYLRFLVAITTPFFKPFVFLERKSNWARKNGYLIACVVTKPQLRKNRVFN